MQETHNLMEELALLDPQKIRLYLDEFEDLYLREDGEVRGPLKVRRAFPISAAGEFILLADQQNKEVGLVRRLCELDRRSRAVLEAELEHTYLGARITRVKAIEIHFHVPHWEVETDRGPRRFELRSSRRDLRVLEGGRILVRDADGNRYEIPDYRRLEPAGRALVEGQI